MIQMQILMLCISFKLFIEILIKQPCLALATDHIVVYILQICSLTS